jgi:hypothetical protein
LCLDKSAFRDDKKRRSFFRTLLNVLAGHFAAEMLELEVGGRDRDRTCGLIHAMDALSQLSYTPVTVQNDLAVVWQTTNILANIPTKFHCHA